MEMKSKALLGLTFVIGFLYQVYTGEYLKAGYGLYSLMVLFGGAIFFFFKTMTIPLLVGYAGYLFQGKFLNLIFQITGILFLVVSTYITFNGYNFSFVL